MIAALYARYSSDNQRAESIVAQLRASREYCRQRGYTIIKEYADEAMTGTNDQRPQYQQMLADAKTDREDRKAQIEELRHERDHYKQDRNELRERLDETDAKIRVLQREVARNGRQIEMMRPFICTDLSCKLRKRGVISEEGEVKRAKVKKEQIQIETNNEEL